MVFGQRYRNKSFVLSFILIIFASLSFYSIRHWHSLEIKALESVKNNQSTLISEKDKLTASQKILNEKSGVFAELPQALTVEQSRALIIEKLDGVAASSGAENFRFQFFDRSSLPLENGQQNSTISVAVDSLLLNGRLNHMEDFLLFVDNLEEKNQYFELRGCDIQRMDQTRNTDNLQRHLYFECLISWYSIGKGT